MSNVLLFDRGSVLIENDVFDALRRLSHHGDGEAASKTKWHRSPAVGKFELGASSPEEFAIELVKESRWNITPNDFLMAFTGWP